MVNIVQLLLLKKMKRITATIISILLLGCVKTSVTDLSGVPPFLNVNIDETDVRMQLQEGKTVWNEHDIVSVFYKNDANELWQFQGKTGDRSGKIARISAVSPSSSYDKVAVLYPYHSECSLNVSAQTLSLMVPSDQTYTKDSYGIGSSLMLSVGDSDTYSLRNLCGWIKVQFVGAGQISEIRFRGNDSEPLCGPATVSLNDYALTIASDGGKEITLNCSSCQALGGEPLAFYIALPPMTFSKGFTVEARTDGRTVTKSTAKTISVLRNHIVNMETASALAKGVSITVSGSSFTAPSFLNPASGGVIFWGDGSQVPFSTPLVHSYSDGKDTHTVEIGLTDFDSMTIDSLSGISEIRIN